MRRGTPSSVTRRPVTRRPSPALLAALAGANLIYGAGMIESGVTFDCGQFVMDNEFARMIKHGVGGIPVDDETLAVDDIAAVGPFGDFLCLDATYATCASRASRSSSTAACARTGSRAASTRPLRSAAREGARGHPGAQAGAGAGRRRGPHPRHRRRDRPGGGRRLKEGRTTVKDQLKQAIIEGNADARQRPHAGAARQRRQRRARSSTTPCCRAWRWSASACAPATASSPRCCSARAPCRAPSTCSSRTSPRATRTSAGTVVIGTVEGDLHDIGKNLVAMMLAGRRLQGRQPRHRGHPGAVRRRGDASTRPTSSA